jgi:hypothetical protein
MNKFNRVIDGFFYYGDPANSFMFSFSGMFQGLGVSRVIRVACCITLSSLNFEAITMMLFFHRILICFS